MSSSGAATGAFPSYGSSSQAQAPLSLTRDFALSTAMSHTAQRTGINNAVQSAQSNGRALSLDGKQWHIDSGAIVIDGPLIGLHGPWTGDTFGSAGVNVGWIPLLSQEPSGAGIIQHEPGADAVTLTGTGYSAELDSFFIDFAGNTVRWLNTGHGVNATPAAVLAGTPDSGIMGGKIRGVRILGHDGNHYGYLIVNSQYLQILGCRSWGGGGLHFINNSVTSDYGNLLLSDWVDTVFIGGSAHGIFLENLTNGVAQQGDFVVLGPRCQSNVWTQTGQQPAGTVAPTSAQCIITYAGTWTNVNWVGDQDFETNVNSPINFPVGQGCRMNGAGAGTLGTSMNNASDQLVHQALVASSQHLQIQVALTPSGGLAAGSYLYWVNVNNGKLGESTLAGGAVNDTFISAPTSYGGICATADYVFWPNGTQIGRFNLSGSGHVNGFITGGNGTQGICTDGTYLYWVNFGNKTIGRALLDGSSVNQAFITGLVNVPWSICTDGAFMYWSQEAAGQIGRATVAGGSVTENFITGCSGPDGIMVNAGELYWVERFRPTLATATAAGTGVNHSFVAGIAANCRCLATDGVSIFVSDLTNTQIAKCTLAGAGYAAFVTGLNSPVGVAVGTVDAARAGASAQLSAKAFFDAGGTVIRDQVVLPAGCGITGPVTHTLDCDVPAYGYYRLDLNNATVIAQRTVSTTA